METTRCRYPMPLHPFASGSVIFPRPHCRHMPRAACHSNASKDPAPSGPAASSAVSYPEGMGVCRPVRVGFFFFFLLGDCSSFLL